MARDKVDAEGKKSGDELDRITGKAHGAAIGGRKMHRALVCHRTGPLEAEGKLIELAHTVRVCVGSNAP
jgi:hypothetical protein